MALETFPYDTAEYLKDAESISLYLEAELEENEMPYLARALTTVARARGGMDMVAEETGLTIDLLDRAAQEVGTGDRGTVIKVMEAYRKRVSSDSQVA
jgi:probable addiction module antidote protein